MALPQVTNPNDVDKIIKYLANKPSGATLKDVKAVLGSNIIDVRKIATYFIFRLITRDGDRIKLTPDVGRSFARAKTDEQIQALYSRELARIPPYRACLEWAFHKELSELPAREVGAYWHDYYSEELGTTITREISHRSACFLQFAAAAGLGEFIPGRRGQPSRVVLNREALATFVTQQPEEVPGGAATAPEEGPPREAPEEQPSIRSQQAATKQLGKAIFVAHGKNTKPLDQIKKILTEFRVPFKVAVDEPNLGRPIGTKVRETMDSCNCAILIFTADEEFKDKDGNTVWRPSENVIYELGAAAYLYENRIVIMKEDKVDFPTNFKDIGYIQFSSDHLEAKTTDILKELVGFKIIKITTSGD
jgi:predicted nucleotide-binding protein